MSSPNDKKGITPTNEGRNDSHLYDEDPDLVQLLAKLGIGDNDHYLSNARIEEIANSDTDEEKRQLAARLLQLQLYAKGLSTIHAYGFKHMPGGSNIFNPLDPLDENRLIKLSDLQGNPGSPQSGE